MYKVGHNAAKKRRRRVRRYAVTTILLIGLGVFIKYQLRTNTVIAKAPPPVHVKIASDVPASKTWDEGLFTIDLPGDWKLASHQTFRTNLYIFQSTDSAAAGRALGIYADAVPATLGINRALSVVASSAQVMPSGNVSDNCASFTAKAGTTLTATPAKWDGYDFLCDLGNTQRDVVGTVSPDGLNRVKLTGATTGIHNFFFTYTDNNIDTDFPTFTKALQSFRLK